MKNYIFLTKFNCLSCKNIFEVYSGNDKEIKTEICGFCHPLFTGKEYSQSRIGKLEVFRKREEKYKKKNLLNKS